MQGERVLIEQKLSKKTHKRRVSEWKYNAWKRRNIEFLNQITNIENNMLEGKVILNIGCGRDTFSTFFESHKAIIIASDVNKEALFEAKASGSKSLVTSDIYNIPFKNESFDVVFCVGVLHHFPNIEEP